MHEVAQDVVGVGKGGPDESVGRHSVEAVAAQEREFNRTGKIHAGWAVKHLATAVVRVCVHTDEVVIEATHERSDRGIEGLQIGRAHV